MITKTFCFLSGIGKKKQQHLHDAGIIDWDDFLAASSVPGIRKQRKHVCDIFLKKAKKALYEEDMAFFSKHLPPSEHHLLYPRFRDEALFLDIETDKKDITVLGMYFQEESKIMVAGVNLDLSLAKKILAQAKIIVTFNGNVFDIPFLKKRYPHLIPPLPTFDVRTLAARNGYKGGLKEIEQTLGLSRPLLVRRVRGGDPLLLYRMWKGSRDPHYLHLLVQYNEEDLVNLKFVAEKLVQESL